MIRRANLEPTKKYKSPQTSSQEIGWITTPLVRSLLSFFFFFYLQDENITNKKKTLIIIFP
jgi:hypothetical protein